MVDEEETGAKPPWGFFGHPLGRLLGWKVHQRTGDPL